MNKPPAGQAAPLASPRVPMLTEAEAVERGRALGIDDYMARMHLFRVLLNHPPLAGALNQLLLSLVDSSRELDSRLRELIIMRVAWLSHCNYEWTQHWQAGLFFGLTENELSAVRCWREADVFDTRARAVLAATDDMLANGTLAPAQWRELQKALDNDAALLEVVACIGNWHMFALMLRALDVPLEGGLPSWPPNGAAPSDA